MASRFRLRSIVTGTVFAVAFAVVGQSRPAQARCSSDRTCSGGPARIMLILDASSPMLNDGAMAAAMGDTDWDRFRSVVAGSDPLFDLRIGPADPVASQVAHFGLIAFGDPMPAPGEQKLMVDYGPCSAPNMDWALDPETSCEAPGCTDPWGGAPITWTFKDGSDTPPGFATPTFSHMPSCDGSADACTGSGRFVHLGIELAHDHRAQYVRDTGFTRDDTTVYANILLIQDAYLGDSTDGEVQAALEAEFADDVVTYVVGFGAGARSPTAGFQMELDNMAAWGSGGAGSPFLAGTTTELSQAMGDILQDLDLPCCRRIDCSEAGGAGGDTGATDSADGWGSAGGSGSATATATDTATDTDTHADTDTGGNGGAGSAGLDDDGGCRCRAHRPAGMPAWVALLGALGFVPMRRRIGVHLTL